MKSRIVDRLVFGKEKSYKRTAYIFMILFFILLTYSFYLIMNVGDVTRLSMLNSAIMVCNENNGLISNITQQYNENNETEIMVYCYPNTRIVGITPSEIKIVEVNGRWLVEV